LNSLLLIFQRCCHTRNWFIFPVIFLAFCSANAQSSSSDLVFTSIPQIIFSTATAAPNDAIHSDADADLNKLIKDGKAFKTILCQTKNNRQVEVYYFPGTSAKRAMIIGGVHGSELSSIELAYNIIDQLAKGYKPFYNVIIVPCLFPDNAAIAMQVPGKIYELAGRYTSEQTPDPNRQMPALGQPFKKETPFDFHGREIERENQFMLSLIQEFKPERIANLHAIRDPSKAGIFADPRTDHNCVSLGFKSDSLLAASMNHLVCINGGRVASPSPDTLTVVYHKDPAVVPEGFIQPRNIQGSQLPAHRGKGISLGSWASTAVNSENESLARPAITLLTIEFPGYKSSPFLEKEQTFNYFLDLNLYTHTVTTIFLGY
jgi:hypothetical protein